MELARETLATFHPLDKQSPLTKFHVELDVSLPPECAMPRLDPVRARRDLAARKAAQDSQAKGKKSLNRPTPSRKVTGARGRHAETVELYASDLAYMDDELSWIELRCRRLGAELQLRGVDEPGNRRKRRGRSNERYTLGHAERATLESRVAALLREEEALRSAIDARIEAHRACEEELALDHLCALHQLDAFERTVLLLASASCFSRGFEERFGELNDRSFSASLEVETIFNFQELSFSDRIGRRVTFTRAGALVRNDLITTDILGRYTSPQDLLRVEIEINSRTFDAMLGDAALPQEFTEFSSLEEPSSELDHVVMAESDRRRILSVVDRHDDWLRLRKTWGFDARIPYGRGALMLFYGEPGTGKTMTAHALARHLGKRILNVDLPTFMQSREADRFLPSLFREARMQNALLFFDECEVIFGARKGGNALMTLLLSEIERFEGVAVLATNLPSALDEALNRRLLVKVHFPKPDRAGRRAIWRQHLPPEAPLAEDVSVDVLAERHELTGGLIKNAVLMAVAAAVHNATDVDRAEITMTHLNDAARDQLLRLSDDNDTLVYPKACLTDVVLQRSLTEQVNEVIAASRNRRTVLEAWGVGKQVGRGKGIVALLSGPPGTGKTLTAEAIASELDRPLLVAGASTVLSKYLGETERNVERLFQVSRARGAVLFIDECDSVLATRDGARNGAWSVSMVTTLLRLLERHEGVVLLATNRPETLDPAFVRRVGHHLRFQLPDTAAREGIWRGLLPETVPVEGQLDLALLARSFPLSGAAIQNASFRAAFRAAHQGRGLRQTDLEVAAAEEEPTDVSGDFDSLSSDGVEA